MRKISLSSGFCLFHSTKHCKINLLKVQFWSCHHCTENISTNPHSLQNKLYFLVWYSVSTITWPRLSCPAHLSTICLLTFQDYNILHPNMAISLSPWVCLRNSLCPNSLVSKFIPILEDSTRSLPPHQTFWCLWGKITSMSHDCTKLSIFTTIIQGKK